MVEEFPAPLTCYIYPAVTPEEAGERKTGPYLIDIPGRCRYLWEGSSMSDFNSLSLLCQRFLILDLCSPS